MGGGVLLHPPHARVAPKHGRTVGRPWSLTPTAVFNLLQLPVTQVPLGLDGRGLPLGVQVVAPHDCDHVSIACALALERATGGWVPPS
jgi:fatty acid amide hydrolase 2